MCYYSTTQPRHRVRSAKEGEDLTLTGDIHGHHYPMGSDGKIVCMKHGTEVHIASLQLSGTAPRRMLQEFNHLIGQPVSGRFSYRHASSYAADRIMLNDVEVELHFLYLAEGTKFYTGPKRSDVAEKLGVNDRSIALDHMPPEPKPEGEGTPTEPAAPADEPVQEPAPEAPARESVTA